MIRKLLLLACVPALACGQEQGAPSVIRFANQDQLSGELESFAKDRLFWNSPIQTKPAAFWLKEVLDLTLPAETPIIKANHEATLDLARGDSVRGQIASVTDDSVELDTWFAGRMKFPRVMVRDVKITDRPELLFRGPSSMEGWTQSVEPEAWRFQSGAFRSVSAGSIGRDVELPDEFRISFDAAWRDSFNLAVILFSDNVSSESPDNGYEISFRRRSVNLQRCGSHNFIGQAQAAELNEDEKARIEFRASARTKNICFYINGKLIEVWTDQAMEKESLGRGIQFISQDNGPIRISGIEVASWDGVLDETPRRNAFANRFRELDFRNEPQKEEPEKADAGRMLLRNGDSIAGEVLSIWDGVITLKTSFDEVKLPVARFRSIALKEASLEEPKRENGDVRAWFMDGTSLVFRLEEMGNGRIRGYSQNFGTVDFDEKAFAKLEFNIYNQKLASLREESGW